MVGRDSLIQMLARKINFIGPITVAEYMREVLTSKSGYYMQGDVFGKKGDFTTSPEISQMFGEMLGVWAVSELRKLGSPKPLKIVELGPGRGSMCRDILRAMEKLLVMDKASVHLVEVSLELSRLQADVLCADSKETPDSPQHHRVGRTPSGLPIYWHHSFQQIPVQGFTCLFANEFFDALPIHKLQKTSDGWREVLIDVDPSSLEGSPKLRYILSRNVTPAAVAFIQNGEERKEVEVCPEAGVIMEQLSTRFEEHGGMGLICDYGHWAEKTDTFRAFRDHKLVDPLESPGSADLTADVDFSMLAQAAGGRLVSVGPLSQGQFLGNMHASTRLQNLKDHAKNDEVKKNLESAYDMLVDPTKMGERFKFMAFFPAVLSGFIKKFPVSGFS